VSARDIAEIHKALADETRLRILRVLQEFGELCVCDVEVGLDVSQSRASRHMNMLRQAGLVEDRRDGQWIYYRIAEPLGPTAASALAALRDESVDDARDQQDIAAVRRSRRSPCRG